MANVLKRHAAQFVTRHPGQAVPQVQSTLAKLSLCRTAALGGRKLKCNSCDHQCVVYNSCGDRHCPRCGGAKRADWLDKTEQLLLWAGESPGQPQVNYFQVVFTLPDVLSALVLGNRREVYALLMRSAWRALDEVLREQQGIEPAALLVLHTWNQQLDQHPHVHALVPGGGPALDGSRWITTRHPTHRRRRKPYLADNRLLGKKFQEHFVAGLLRLHRLGRIAFDPPRLPGLDEPHFSQWVEQLARQAWNVFIQPPPGHSQPQQMVKYLARYLTGGPISDRRLISCQRGEVTFWARGTSQRSGNRPRPFTLPAVEFLRRWSMHILPKGLTKTRSYGGFSCRRRQEYLPRCRRLLRIRESDLADQPPSPSSQDDASAEESRRCPRCQDKLVRVASVPRPSWRDLLRSPASCPLWYQPWISIPRRPCIRIRGPAPSAPADPRSL